MNRYTALTMAILAFSLSACNSSNDAGSGSSTVAGKAADGYLKNAKVCLDANQNFKCDTGEVSAMTTANGGYELNASADALNRFPLLLEAIAGLTSDTDLVSTTNPDGLVTNDFILYAPPRSSFISPFTSLQYELMQQNPQLSAQAAAQYVQARFDLSLSVGQDYIAAQNNDAHDKASRIVQTIQNTLNSLNETTTGQIYLLLLGQASLNRVIYAALLENPEKLDTQTATPTFTEAELNNIQSASLLANYVGEVNPDTVLSKGLAEPIISTFEAPITFPNLTNDVGVPTEDSRYQTGLAFETLKLSNGQLQQQRTLVGKSDLITTTIAPSYALDWNGTNWQVVDAAKPLGFNIATRSSCTNLSCLMVMAEYDLSQKPVMPLISQALDVWNSPVDSEKFASQYQLTQAVFPTGAKAYKITFKAKPDVLTLNCDLISNTASTAKCGTLKNVTGTAFTRLDQILDETILVNGTLSHEIQFTAGDSANSGSYTVYNITKSYPPNGCDFSFNGVDCTPQITKTAVEQGNWQRSTFQGLDVITYGQSFQGVRKAFVVYEGQVTAAHLIEERFRGQTRILVNSTTQTALTNLLESQMESSTIAIKIN